MKRLNCGHSVHPECLLYMIKEKDFVCEVDQETICPGYLQAMGIKVSKKKGGKMADCTFMRAE